jgi:hypothetical protein
VDRALLAAVAPELDPVGDRVVGVPAPYALDKSGLLATVAAALRCRTVRRKQYRDGAYEYDMHLFGFASDLERTDLLYTSLLVKAAFGMAAAAVPEWESVAAFRRSWLADFTPSGTDCAWPNSARDDAPGRPGRRSSWCWPIAPAVDRRVSDAYPRLRRRRRVTAGQRHRRQVRRRSAGRPAECGSPARDVVSMGRNGAVTSL